MTHVCGVDFSGMYPSVMASHSHPFISFTNHVMHMPGRFCEHITDKVRIWNIIKDINPKDSEGNPIVFFASVKGTFPPNKINTLINFPPIIRQFYTEDTFDEMLSTTEYPKKKAPRKLTQLVSTMNEYTSFYCYYLWLLMSLGFVINDCNEMDVFYAMEKYNFYDFVKEFTDTRVAAKDKNNKGLEEMCKLVLNSSYGKDGMNTSKYSTTKLLNRNSALFYQTKSNFVNTRQINEDLFLVQLTKTSYSIKTALQCAVATLDNAKYWYVNFIYNFMYRCLDMSRIHFIEGDTDSSYWAIAGDPEDKDKYKQRFKNVIKNKEFYEEWVYKWFPRPGGGTKDKKKLLGLAVENEGDVMIAVSPKCYYIHCYDKDTKNVLVDVTKAKGYSQDYLRLKRENYEGAVGSDGVSTLRTNMLMRMVFPKGEPAQMMKQIQNKKVITPVHDKMRVLKNYSCAPFIPGLKKDDYIIVSEKNIKL
jgi:hypothetical protein